MTAVRRVTVDTIFSVQWMRRTITATAVMPAVQSGRPRDAALAVALTALSVQLATWHLVGWGF